MKTWNARDHSKAICATCEAVVPTTFDHYDVAFESGLTVAKGILAATCDGCGQLVAIPPQSTPAIRAARDAG